MAKVKAKGVKSRRANRRQSETAEDVRDAKNVIADATALMRSINSKALAWQKAQVTAYLLEQGWPAHRIWLHLASRKNLQKTFEEMTLAELEQRAAAPAPSRWTFAPGLAIYRGHQVKITGKPWATLKAVAESRHQTATENDLLKTVWPDEVVMGDTVRDAIRNANNAIRKSLKGKVQLPPFPLANVARGTGQTAWRLELA